MLFNWTALHPDEVERIAGIYPVCDLRSYPGIVTAAKAYGLTVQQMGMQLNQHNPIDTIPSIFPPPGKGWRAGTFYSWRR